MKELLKNKKAQFDNYAIVITFLFVFGFTSIIAVLMYNSIITAMGNNIATFNGSVAETTALRFQTGMQILDYLTILLMIVLIIGVGVTSYRLNSAPVFFIVSILMASFLGMISYFFSYIFSQLVSQAVFTTTITIFPRTIIVCTNLHWVALVVFIIGSITLYAKKEQGKIV